MMKLNYDDAAAAFFGLTMLALYLLPATWIIFRRLAVPTSAASSAAPQKPRTEAERVALERQEAGGTKPRLWTRGFTIFVVVTAVAFIAFLILLISVSGNQELAQYDPYAILGISAAASERDIKGAYRKLSLLHHPDRGGDPEQFQAVAKAYAALTDPVVAENYKKYGNPDGRQSLQISVGLPHFLQGGITGYLFLALYMVVLVVLIPILMCRCYRANRNVDSATGLHVASVPWLQHRVLQQAESVRLRFLPEIVAGCMDFKDLHLTPMDNQTLLRIVNVLREERIFQGITRYDATRNHYLMAAEIIERNVVLQLLHANRQRLKDIPLSPTIEAAIDTILRKLPTICDLIVSLCAELEAVMEQRAAQNPNLVPVRMFDQIKSVLEFEQMMTQGLWESDNSLRQLFSADDVALLYSKATKMTRKPTNLQQFLELPASERPILATMAEADREDAEALCADMPLLKVTPKFSVLDEDNICEGDVVTATITLQHPQLANDDAPVPPVYAPAFPKSREEEWRVFIVDERLRGGQKRIVMPAFDKVVVKKAKTDVTLRFQAPMKAGAYTYTVFVISTCYMGLDVRQEVTFSVEPRPKFTKLDAPAASAEEEEEDKDALLPELSLENMLGGARREVAEEDSDLEDMEDEGEEEAAGAPAASATAATADGSGAKATNNVAVSGKPLKSGAALKKAPAAEADDEFASIGMNRGKEKSKKGKPAAASASAVAAAAPGETTSA